MTHASPSVPHDSPDPQVVVAGAGGDLGGRITRALVARGAPVCALVRDDADPADVQRVRDLGAKPVAADPHDVDAVAAALDGATCVVSALNGLREVVLDRQSVLIDAAVRAGVPRFVPSDFSADFTRSAPGGNRNLDLRREFMGRADRAAISVTSVLNGAFMDMLGHEMPIIQPRVRRVLHWGDPHQRLDFTTKDDVAAYTAAVALDPTTPRLLRIAGDSLDVREMARVLTEVTGHRYRTLRVGGLGGPVGLGAMIAVARTLAPSSDEVFPAWQGMQYSRDMFGGDVQLEPLDNGRYPEVTFSGVRDHVAADPVFPRADRG